MHSTDHQTVSFLRRRFEEAGIHIDTRRGQNFLIDLNLQRLLVDTAQLGPQDVVLEVGTGTGALTGLIARRAAAVVTVEVDRRLYQLASEELWGLENVTMLCQDAMKNKNTLAPAVLDAVKRQLAATPNGHFKLVANLPYNIATPILTNLLACDVAPRSMTATIQKELADRMRARPGTKDYGALSIWMQCQSRVELVRTLAPSVFWPRPKVTSAIIHIEVDDRLRCRIPDLDFFHGFVRAIFLHRRKFLRGVLHGVTKGRLSKVEVDQVLAELQLGAESRAEELNVETMLALAEAVRSDLTAKRP